MRSLIYVFKHIKIKATYNSHKCYKGELKN